MRGRIKTIFTTARILSWVLETGRDLLPLRPQKKKSKTNFFKTHKEYNNNNNNNKQKKAMEHEGDNYTNCDWCFWHGN